MGKKILIIKLDGMGDVLRTTPILRCFNDDEVTWITGAASLPLLEGIRCVKAALPIGMSSQVENNLFDELYNFDEDEMACSLATGITAGKKKGYGLKDGGYFPFDHDADYAYRMSKDDELKFRLNKKTYQRVIFEMAGFRWENEDYILGYKPKSRVQYDVGINYLVGDKFPNKAWPFWRELAAMLDSVSLQRQFGRLEEYIEWINSCRVIVTGDSLGMHIALALGKKVIILMGSTSWVEIETYGRGIVLRPQLACSPCYKKNKCEKLPFCMELITPQMVYSEIAKIGL